MLLQNTAHQSHMLSNQNPYHDRQWQYCQSQDESQVYCHLLWHTLIIAIYIKQLAFDMDVFAALYVSYFLARALLRTLECLGYSEASRRLIHLNLGGQMMKPGIQACWWTIGLNSQTIISYPQLLWLASLGSCLQLPAGPDALMVRSWSGPPSCSTSWVI